ncbi:hypothetical protein SD71_09345 [Cohnella kolymensis]|uniref:Bypass of forespore C C-terminal domain-containing protein n=1 Tax=Cohnella kolymensis TaxID=1590652 RepID=A0ABR5A558_9BACL|nr:hypothetical protein [Cohnella kolymensis]KIL36154.1 hypothetical protein SD71_09345 [Cohnella kolymensis]
MEHSIMLRIRHWSRQPKAVLVLTGCIFIILNAVYFAWQTVPGYLQRNQAHEELDAVQRQWNEGSQQPNAQKVSDEAVVQLLREVPTNIVTSEVVSTLLQFSAEAKVWISLFKQGSETLIFDQLEQQISGSETAGTAPRSSADSSAADTPTEGARGESGILHEESFELTLQGSLPNLLNFFDLLASNTAITNIGTWTLGEISESEAQTIPELTDKKGNYSMTVTFSMFSIPEYAAVFGSDRQERPSINEMLEQLQVRYPAVKTFESISSGEAKK